MLKKQKQGLANSSMNSAETDELNDENSANFEDDDDIMNIRRIQKPKTSLNMIDQSLIGIPIGFDSENGGVKVLESDRLDEQSKDQTSKFNNGSMEFFQPGASPKMAFWIGNDIENGHGSVRRNLFAKNEVQDINKRSKTPIRNIIGSVAGTVASAAQKAVVSGAQMAGQAIKQALTPVKVEKSESGSKLRHIEKHANSQVFNDHAMNKMNQIMQQQQNQMQELIQHMKSLNVNENDRKEEEKSDLLKETQQFNQNLQMMEVQKHLLDMFTKQMDNQQKQMNEMQRQLQLQSNEMLLQKQRMDFEKKELRKQQIAFDKQQLHLAKNQKLNPNAKEFEQSKHLNYSLNYDFQKWKYLRNRSSGYI